MNLQSKKTFQDNKITLHLDGDLEFGIAAVEVADDDDKQTSAFYDIATYVTGPIIFKSNPELETLLCQSMDIYEVEDLLDVQRSYVNAHGKYKCWLAHNDFPQLVKRDNELYYVAALRDFGKNSANMRAPERIRKVNEKREKAAELLSLDPEAIRAQFYRESVDIRLMEQLQVHISNFNNQIMEEQTGSVLHNRACSMMDEHLSAMLAESASLRWDKADIVVLQAQIDKLTSQLRDKQKALNITALNAFIQGNHLTNGQDEGEFDPLLIQASKDAIMSLDYGKPFNDQKMEVENAESMHSEDIN